MTYYSEDRGISYINNYVAENHDGKFKCDHLTEKGRILLSARRFKQGEVMFVEPPLLIVAERASNPWFIRLSKLLKEGDFDYDALWYWAALNALCDSQVDEEAKKHLATITQDQQHRLLLLYHDAVDAPSEDIKDIISHFGLTVDPLLLETLLQIWILNCFEHNDDPLGYATYFMSSFMSHSCLPCAVWHYDEDNFVLRARSDIEIGQEICCSYLSEDALLESTISRRNGLEESKHFVCMCERCTEPLDTCRGFVCPQCREGSIYPPNDSICQADKPARCQCGHIVGEQEWSGLLALEEELEKRVRDWEKRGAKMGPCRGFQDAQVDAALDNAGQVFTQHWLVAKLWSQACEYFEYRGDARRAIDLVRQRIKLVRSSYPGLNGAYAWALEELGDILHKTIADNKGAKKAYEEALETLRLMFGDVHEYTRDTAAKLQHIDKVIACVK